MKTDWLEGEAFCYCTNKDNIERGTLADKIPLGGKYIVEYVYNDCVTSDGLVFYFHPKTAVVPRNVFKSSGRSAIASYTHNITI